jgi:hypothetical protein
VKLVQVVQCIRHPVVSLDVWWEHKSGELRLDHYPANLCLLIGLICSSLSIILIGPVPNSRLTLMSPDLQILMCICIFIGCLIKLHGVLAHSRYWFPNISLKHCYQLGYNGAPIGAAGLFVYGFYLLEGTQNWLSALGTILTPLLGLGILLQGGVYWLESRRIEKVERYLIGIAKRDKVNGDD